MSAVSRFVTLVIVCVLAFSLVGCQKIAEKATEKAIEGATGVKVDTDKESVTITGEDGSSITAGSDGELPDGFPEDVPVYEGEIVSSLMTEGNYTVAIETKDDATTVWDWYGTELESAGWTQTSEFKVDDGGMRSAEKGDMTLQVTVGAGTDGEPTTVTIFTGTKQ